jgi:uncharacterized protein DUF2188
METPMSASTIHVEPTARGRWIVRHDDERESLSEHDSATDAQRVACDLAHIEGASAVLLHDRYARVHHVPIDDPDPATTKPGTHGDSARRTGKTAGGGSPTHVRLDHHDRPLERHQRTE